MSARYSLKEKPFTQVYTCRDCGHTDNEQDPRTRIIIKPIHVVKMNVSDACCGAHGVAMDVGPVEVITPEVTMGNYCLICGRFCEGGFEYETE